MGLGGCVEATRVVSEAGEPRGGSILPSPFHFPPLPPSRWMEVVIHRRGWAREVTFGARRRGPPLCNVGVGTCMCRPSGGTVKPGTGRRTDAGPMGLASASRRAARWREPSDVHRGAHGLLESTFRPTRAHGLRIPRFSEANDRI